MKELYKNILYSIPDKSGREKYEAISGMEDVLRCEDFPDEGKPIFAKLQEYLLTEEDEEAQSLIFDALYEGMLNQYDDKKHIEGLQLLLNGHDSKIICKTLDVLGASINDDYNDLIKKFLRYENSEVRGAAKRNM
ncbi:hypothetical protein MNBD_GAMMA10-1084 [hydrothermal vent metagenome]|uniref:HEAT repeat domain-containing protein n=1 Tax=hydrothermal vent metagenome TaxID=652676 RepID=A0A3B0Y0K5_9ZZZZ